MKATSISDVSVIGGGPAGLSAAIALSQAGCQVTVIDCAIPPIDKACGEGLMPDSLAVLDRLGIAVPFNVGYRFRGIRFADARSSVLATFPNGQGIGLRRTVLHDLLLQRAQDLGVTLRWGAKHVQLAGDQVSIGGQIVKSDFVVAADGQNSPVRKHSSLQRVTHQRRRYGFRRHYRVTPWSAYVELHWGRNCQVYITPVAQDEVCVVSMSRDSNMRLDNALEQFPELRTRLSDAAAVSSETGALSVSRKLRRVIESGLALVGDSSGSVDAVTGEGLCLAFKQALSLAEALTSGKLDAYQKEHARLSRRPRLMGSLMLTLDKHMSFQRKALASLGQNPEIFSSLLALHVGEGSCLNLLSWRLVPLCLTFLEV